MNWIPFPRLGTHFGDGTWLCTVEKAGGRSVEILDLEGGVWFRRGVELKARRERVIAVAHMPEPAGTAVRRESKYAARIRALVGF